MGLGSRNILKRTPRVFSPGCIQRIAIPLILFKFLSRILFFLRLLWLKQQSETTKLADFFYCPMEELKLDIYWVLLKVTQRLVRKVFNYLMSIPSF